MMKYLERVIINFILIEKSNDHFEGDKLVLPKNNVSELNFWS